MIKNTSPPLVDNRSLNDILDEIKALAKSYLNNKWIYSADGNEYKSHTLPQSFSTFSGKDLAIKNPVLPMGTADVGFSDDVGVTVSKIFASMYLELLTRLNKVLERNYIEYLNVLGFDLAAPMAAKAPVMFNLVDGVIDDVYIPKGTKVTSKANEKHDELEFETLENMMATRSKLCAVFSVNCKFDKIFGHTEDFINHQPFKIFNDIPSSNQQKHVLYFGHEYLNIRENSAEIRLSFSSNYPCIEEILRNGIWEYKWNNSTKNEINDEDAFLLKLCDQQKPSRGSDKKESSYGGNTFNICLKWEDSKRQQKINMEKTKVAGAENYWIRCKCNVMPLHEKDDINSFPSISTVQGYINLDNDKDGYVSPDLIFYKDIQLELPQVANVSVDNGDKSKNFIYPFGKQPLTYDIFYIASNNCFSKRKSSIILDFFDLEPGFSDIDSNDDHRIEPIISWEYWNGNGWRLLSPSPSASATKREKNDVTITSFNFECPFDIEKCSVNGSENYWIRIRLVSGDYGKMKLKQAFKPQIKFFPKNEDSQIDFDIGEYQWDYNDIKPPKFLDLKIICKMMNVKKSKFVHNDKNNSGSDLNVIELNNISYQHHDLYRKIIGNKNSNIHSLEEPFIGVVDINDSVKLHINSENGIRHDSSKYRSVLQSATNGTPAACLYLGFDKIIQGGPCLIYFHLREQVKYVKVGENLSFYYYSNAGGWKKLYAEDGTNYFTNKGRIKFYVPQDFDYYTLFGKKLFWIKIEDSNHLFDLFESASPLIEGIYQNTVSCVNASVIEDEILLRDNLANDDSAYLFSKRPLTTVDDYVEEIWIKENQSLQENEKSQLLKDNRLKEIFDEYGHLNETWVLWKDLHSPRNLFKKQPFLSSDGYDDRFYVIDRISGKITLGAKNLAILKNVDKLDKDENVTVPSNTVDQEAIIKANYVTGGSVMGNVKKNEITALKSLIPYIDSVENIEGAEGGSDTQSVREALETFPNIIKSRNQPITANDFENMVQHNFKEVGRATCFPITDINGNHPSPGNVLLVIIPKSYDLLSLQNTKIQKKVNGDGINNSGLNSINSTFNDPRYPSVGLRENIRQFLSKVCSNNLISTKKLHIIGPLYFEVSIAATINVVSINDVVDIEQKAIQSIRKYLDPITGGRIGNGWDYKKILTVSETYHILSLIEEIDHISNIKIRVKFANDDIIYFDDDGDILRKSKQLLPHSMISDGNRHDLKVQFIEPEREAL